jgi:hypothetical protein
VRDRDLRVLPGNRAIADVHDYGDDRRDDQEEQQDTGRNTTQHGRTLGNRRIVRARSARLETHATKSAMAAGNAPPAYVKEQLLGIQGSVHGSHPLIQLRARRSPVSFCIEAFLRRIGVAAKTCGKEPIRHV